MKKRIIATMCGLAFGFLTYAQSVNQLMSGYTGNANYNASTKTLTFASTGKIIFNSKSGTLKHFWDTNPNEISKVIIKSNVTVTGGLNMNGNSTLEGENRKTSVLFGTSQREYASQNEGGVELSAIKSGKTNKGTVYIKNLTSLNPYGFHVRAWNGAKIHVSDCDFIDNRGGAHNNSDGIGGSDGSTVKRCYFSTGDDIIKAYNDMDWEDITINMIDNTVPIQLGWGDYANGSNNRIKNLTITGNKGRWSPNKTYGIIVGRTGNITSTLTIDGLTVDHPEAHLVMLWESNMMLKGSIVNADINLKAYTQPTYNKGNDTQFTVCGTTERKAVYKCKTGETDPNPTITNIEDLKILSTSCDRVNLTWSDVDGEDQYRVRRKLVGGSYEILADLPANASSYIDNTVEENKTYEYMVRPMQNGVAVKLSNVPSITIQPCGEETNPNDCAPWFSNSGVWKGKGRIAISSDGNEHDKDDWAATPFSLALLAAKGLQDNLTVYTFSDHIWGSNHDHADAAQQMRISALEGAIQFGFTKTKFIEAVANPNAAYAAMTAEINKSTADNPLIIVAAGPMHVVGKAISDAEESKLKYVRLISHSNWNDKHSDNSSNWENHSGWTWQEIENTFKSKGLIVDHITDQNGGTGYDGMRASASKFDWLLTHSAKNNVLYKSGSWKWLHDRQVVAKKGTEFDPSDAGMIIYMLTGKEKTDPNDAKELMVNPIAPCSSDGGTGSAPVCDGITDVNGIIMLEAENTNSPLGEWIKKTDNAGFSGSGHLEFTGNGINGGPVSSPLKYSFTVQEEGLYRLFIRARKRLDGAESDKCNDGYVKMEGDFDESPTAGNNHNDNATKDLLTKNTKFFGGPASGWGWANQLDAGGETNKRQAVYYFKKGETYTFTLSGRSIRWNVDRIIFRREGISNNDAYAIIEETGCNGDTDTDSIPVITDIKDLKVVVQNCSTTVLTWNDVEAEDAYRIRRRILGGNYEILADVAAGIKTYTDKSVKGGVEYEYMVRPMQNGIAVKISNVPNIKLPNCQSTESKDCAGIVGGTAVVDACGVCVGGTTGISPNSPKTWYADSDGDGFGDPTFTIEACEKPQGYVTTAGDLCPQDINKVDPEACGCGEVEGSCAVTGLACDLPNYSAYVEYSKTGTEVIYQGKSYQNKWYTKGNIPGTSDVWELTGFCGATPLTCADYTIWNSGSVYASPGTMITYDGNIYSNRWYSSGNKPGTNDVWLFEGPCADGNVTIAASVLVEVYPNPVSGDLLTIEFSEAQSNVRLIVYNNFQQEVISETVGKTNSVQLNIAGLIQGNYTLKIISDQLLKTVQLMKY